VTLAIGLRGITIRVLAPLVDGGVPGHAVAATGDDAVRWVLDGAGAVVASLTRERDAYRIDVAAEGLDRRLDSLGLRLEASGVERYLRNGYHSWDGSYFAAPGTPPGDGPPAKAPTLGFAMTALVPVEGEGAVVLGADRHDRFQTELRFGGTAAAMTVDVATLLDRTGASRGEPLFVFDGAAVEDTLRRWSRRVADAAPLPPRVPARRITGWCSWYNLYAAIDEGVILEHLAAAQRFRDAHRVPLDIFQIDDGFTPEMGDWLDVRPQFPRGMAPLLADVAAAGFAPGLWIAPFLVGNRSRLFAEHPDWVVGDREAGGPLIAMHFYGEFRWHKRSEEYHVLDVTHPDAAAYIAKVCRTWTADWGARYIKADFLLHGAEYGPKRARWHQDGLSRIAIWRRMMQLIRDAIGEDVLLAGCGCPLWASPGFVDAVRIGRDVGVSWHGEYSAESLLRDLQTRNHAHNILWQADPDCILLRDRFHDLRDEEVVALARFAGGAGGVLMTSDTLDTLSADRAALFAGMLRAEVTGCDFADLGRDRAIVTQRLRAADHVVGLCRFNPTDTAAQGDDGRLVPPHTLIGWDNAQSAA
jgi:alpha-galactosidase